MTLDKSTRERMLAHCREIRDDDAVDPREFFKKREGGARHRRKTLQLCGQVFETLSLVLAGEFDDPLLQGLRVESVDPAPDASQLAVTVRGEVAPDSAEAAEIRERLAKISGRLRCEVAAAITRKRAPKLVLHLIGAESFGPPTPPYNV